ncbi:hypothetical protein MLD38_022749 [Melastoma candidum]|uniref:Uncharacterized protein n=1 Tax=Melastoma candidum TaxID=119954 RepID=A0ACB9QNC8_9MYRT|nr:hypothetical protein MLD38_022749 [Melastoma candidum]
MPGILELAIFISLLTTIYPCVYLSRSLSANDVLTLLCPFRISFPWILNERPDHRDVCSHSWRPLYLQFQTSHIENMRYLRTLGLLTHEKKPPKLPSLNLVDQMLATVNFLKSKGFKDCNFSRVIVPAALFLQCHSC